MSDRGTIEAPSGPGDRGGIEATAEAFVTPAAETSLAKKQAAIMLDETTCTPNYTPTEFGPMSLHSSSVQGRAAVAGLSGERALVVYEGTDQEYGALGGTALIDPQGGIFGRVVHRDASTMYPATGWDYGISRPVGLAGDQRHPEVAARGNGANTRVAAVWQTKPTTTSNWSIGGSLWTWSHANSALFGNATFSPAGTSGDQLHPAVEFVRNPVDTRWVVAWETGGGQIYANICDSPACDGEFLVSGDLQDCSWPRVDSFRVSAEHDVFGISHDWPWIVVFSCWSSADERHRVFYRRYDEAGTAIDGAPVAIGGLGTATVPDVATLRDNDFAIVWTNNEQAPGWSNTTGLAK